MSHSEHDRIFPADHYPPEWEPPLLAPSLDVLIWVVRVLAADVATWEAPDDADRALRRGFLLYLADQLPPDGEHPEIAVPAPALKVS